MGTVSSYEASLLAVVSRHLGVSQECLLQAFEDRLVSNSLTEFLTGLLPSAAQPRPRSDDRWQLEDGFTPRSSSSGRLRHRQQSAVAPKLSSRIVAASPRAHMVPSEVGEGELSSPLQLYGEQLADQPQLFYNSTFEADPSVVVTTAQTAFESFPFDRSGQQPTAAGPSAEPLQYQPQQQPVGDNAAATRVQQQESSTAPALEEIRLYQEAESYKQALGGCKRELGMSQQDAQQLRTQVQQLQQQLHQVTIQLMKSQQDLTSTQQELYDHKQRVERMAQTQQDLEQALLQVHVPHAAAAAPRQQPVQQVTQQSAQPVSQLPQQSVQSGLQQSIQPVPTVLEQPAASQMTAAISKPRPQDFAKLYPMACSMAHNCVEEYDRKRPVSAFHKQLMAWQSQLEALEVYLPASALANIAKGRISSKFMSSRGKTCEAIETPSTIAAMVAALTALQPGTQDDLELARQQIYNDFLAEGSDPPKCFSALGAEYEQRGVEKPAGADLSRVLFVFGTHRHKRLRELLSSRCSGEADYQYQYQYQYCRD